jgi:S1-C subfamily serine protease
MKGGTPHAAVERTYYLHPTEYAWNAISTIVALIVLLAFVFGTGLFAGWVFGTRGSQIIQPGLTPAATTPPATASGTTLEAMREAAVEKVRPAVVQVNVVTTSGEGLGSGVILDSRGYILTNNHVIAGAQRIQVTLYDGTRLSAQLAGTDPLDDLAVVKVSTSAKFTAATLGDSSKLQVGQEVLVIGNPLGITQTVTSASSARWIALSRTSRTRSRRMRPSTWATAVGPW